MGKSKANEDRNPRDDQDDRDRAAWYDAWDPRYRPADYPKPSNR